MVAARKFKLEFRKWMTPAKRRVVQHRIGRGSCDGLGIREAYGSNGLELEANQTTLRADEDSAGVVEGHARVWNI